MTGGGRGMGTDKKIIMKRERDGSLGGVIPELS